jgi:hypothetical protein
MTNASVYLVSRNKERDLILKQTKISNEDIFVFSKHCIAQKISE